MCKVGCRSRCRSSRWALTGAHSSPAQTIRRCSRSIWECWTRISRSRTHLSLWMRYRCSPIAINGRSTLATAHPGVHSRLRFTSVDRIRAPPRSTRVLRWLKPRVPNGSKPAFRPWAQHPRQRPPDPGVSAGLAREPGPRTDQPNHASGAGRLASGDARILVNGTVEPLPVHDQPLSGVGWGPGGRRPGARCGRPGCTLWRYSRRTRAGGARPGWSAEARRNCDLSDRGQFPNGRPLRAREWAKTPNPLPVSSPEGRRWRRLRSRAPGVIAGGASSVEEGRVDPEDIARLIGIKSRVQSWSEIRPLDKWVEEEVEEVLGGCPVSTRCSGAVYTRLPRKSELLVPIGELLHFLSDRGGARRQESLSVLG